MSKVHDQAIHLLAQRDPGTYLTPESREMVLRAIEEADDLRKEIARLQEVAAASQKLFGVKVARVEFLMHDDGTVNLIATVPGSDEKALAVYCGEQLQRIFDEAALLKDSPAAPKECVEVPSDTPLPNGAAGDVSEKPNGRAVPPAAGTISARDPGSSRAVSQQEPEPRDQVAGAEGSTDEGPAGAPEQDREAGALRLAGGADPGEGATASPAAAKKWGHNARGSAWHLWSDATEGSFADGEWTFRAPCGEEVKGAIVYADRPVADNACLDCAASIGWEVPEKLSLPSEKKKRNAPDLCVIAGCTEKGSSRNQWCCGSHAAKLNLTERRAALDAWKKARMNGQSPALAGGTP